MAKKLIPLLIAVAAVVLLTLAKTSEPSATSPQTTPVTLPPVTTAAVNTPIASGSCTDTVRWSLEQDGTLIISGSGAIPDFEKGANNQPWRPYWKSITALVVESGITRVGDRAFQGYRYLESAAIGSDVTAVGEWAFQNCTSLTDVTLPPAVTLETGAFRNTPAEWDVAAIGSEVYAQGKYAEALSQVTLTGNLRDDVINVALSQVGYHEGNSEKDYAGGNAKGEKDYTEYGRRLGSSGTAWCSEFASWCIRMAGVPQQAVSVSYSANTVNFTKNSSAAYYTWDVTAFCDGGYMPQKGDLLLWAWDKEAHSTEEDLSHTSILWEAKGNADGTVLLKTIDGNSNNQVRVRQYTVNAKDGTLTDRKGRLCYIISPDYEETNAFH